MRDNTVPSVTESTSCTRERVLRGAARVVPAALLALAIAAPAGVAGADPRPGTFGWDYRNHPVAAPLLGYATVALSPRALGTPAVDSLRAAGARLLLWMQPVWFSWHGRPIRDIGWDAGLLYEVERLGATLRDTTGAPCTLFGPGEDAATVLDFGTPGLPAALAAYVVNYARARGGADGVLLDYGCGDLAWTVTGVAPAAWRRWRAGYGAFLDSLHAAEPGWRVLAQCDRWTEVTRGRADGILLERAGWTLNPPGKVWTMLTAAPGGAAGEARASAVWVQDATPARRRLFAAMALAAGADFHWSDLAGASGGVPRRPNLRDPEHFALDLGAPRGPWRELGEGVVERRFERGFALFNLAAAPYEFAGDGRTWRVAADDGLVAQTRDAAGRPMRWRTGGGEDER